MLTKHLFLRAEGGTQELHKNLRYRRGTARRHDGWNPVSYWAADGHWQTTQRSITSNVMCISLTNLIATVKLADNTWDG